MSKHKSYREQSKIDWGTNQEANLDREQIMLGAVLRLADAVEKIAKSYPFEKLYSAEQKLEYYKTRTTRLERSNAGLKGAVTRIKGQTLGHGKKKKK